MEYTVKIYQTSTGKSPFNEWLLDLSDRKAKAAIHLRIERLRTGLFGDCKVLGAGIFELKLDIGPGYRVYFSKTGTTIILILSAGSKKNQQKDISLSKKYFEDYKVRIGGKNT